jgi:hypothetical protein
LRINRAAAAIRIGRRDRAALRDVRDAHGHVFDGSISNGGRIESGAMPLPQEQTVDRFRERTQKRKFARKRAEGGDTALVQRDDPSKASRLRPFTCWTFARRAADAA